MSILEEIKMDESLEELRQNCSNCKRCKLCTTRQNIVFGVGNENANVMFIGEGPGADEDIKRRTFCRKSWTAYE